MNRLSNNLRVVACAVFAVVMAGCQSVRVPKIDIMKTPQFSEEAANVANGQTIPKAKDAPESPADIRSATQWDRDALALQKLRDAPDGIDNISGPTDREATSEYNQLKAKAQAYKKDDPRSGPLNQSFPKYKPRP